MYSVADFIADEVCIVLKSIVVWKLPVGALRCWIKPELLELVNLNFELPELTTY